METPTTSAEPELAPPEVAGEDPPPQAPSGPQAVEQWLADFEHLRQHLWLYVSARADMAWSTLRRILILAALAVLGMLAGAAFVVTCVVCLMIGISGGLAQLFGGPLWLGYLVTGAGLAALTALAIFLGLRLLAEKSRRRINDKYARRSVPAAESRRQAAAHASDAKRAADQRGAH